jgi:DNA modification methylase
LKEILGFDDKYDKIMTETHYVLQTVRHHPKGKNPGDVWSIPLERFKGAHFSIFPTELPKRIIQAFCPKGGVVLDPFAGSGTTGKAAMELGRKSILIDIKPEYKELMLRRCGLDKPVII